MFKPMIQFISKYKILLIILLCFVSRLPQFISGNIFLDGDECIMGLMAKHFAEGKETPFFFYGQSFGFSFIEVFFMRLSYALFGVSDISVKIAMLSLWTLGIVFFYKAVQQLDKDKNGWLSLLITIIFVFSPSWAIWSMKARGGYLTAFTLFTITVYLILNEKRNKSLVFNFVIGLLTVIIYQSQPLWLAGLFPIISYQLIVNRKLYPSLVMFSGLGLGSVIFYFLKIGLSNFWSPQVLNYLTFSFSGLLKIPNQIYENLKGTYFYTINYEGDVYSNLWSYSMTFLLFTILVYGIFTLFVKEKWNFIFHTFCFSVFATLGYLALIPDNTPRYLLPLTGCLMLMLYPFLAQKKFFLYTVIPYFILIGGLSLYNFKDFNNEKSLKYSLTHLIEGLDSKEIQFVYCNHPLLQWQLMFYSKESVIARYVSSTDRYPKYTSMVDAALSDSERKVGLVGFYNPQDNKWGNKISSIDHRFFIYENPGIQVLKDNGFKFKECVK